MVHGNKVLHDYYHDEESREGEDEDVRIFCTYDKRERGPDMAWDSYR